VEWEGGVPVRHEEEASALGWTLSEPMLNLLGHPSNLWDAFPIRRGVEDDLPAWCRGHRSQPYHAEPDGSPRLVHVEVARYLVYTDFPVPDIAAALGLRVGVVRVAGWGALRELSSAMSSRARTAARRRVESRQPNEPRPADDSLTPVPRTAGTTGTNRREAGDAMGTRG
jgi:hypothetical protein